MASIAPLVKGMGSKGRQVPVVTCSWSFSRGTMALLAHWATEGRGGSSSKLPSFFPSITLSHSDHARVWPVTWSLPLHLQLPYSTHSRHFYSFLQGIHMGPQKGERGVHPTGTCGLWPLGVGLTSFAGLHNLVTEYSLPTSGTDFTCTNSLEKERGAMENRQREVGACHKSAASAGLMDGPVLVPRQSQKSKCMGAAVAQR